MKGTVFSLISTGIFVCLAVIAYYNTQTEAYVGMIKRQYRSYMTVACESAMDSVVLTDYKSGALFNLESNRHKAIDIFLKTLAISFNKEGTYAVDEITKYVPLIILVDYDGFYIWHGEQAVVSMEAVVAADNDYHTEIREFVSWSETVGNYVIKYHLNDYIKLTDVKTGSIYYGSREEVNNYFDDEVLSFLSETKSFEQRKRYVMASAIKETVEYYINNNSSSELNVGYSVEFATLLDEEWGRVFNSPTILAFLQGKQLKEFNSDIVLNIYSFSGTELMKTYHYFIDEADKYHCLEELLDAGRVVNVGGRYYYDGMMIDTIYNSMEECARLGAYPAAADIN